MYTLSDALAVAVWLNVFVRQSKYVAMANIAQSVNVISPLMTTKDGIVKQTTWWPLLLFSKYMRGWTVATHVSCSSYNGETEPKWMRGTVDTPWLDVSATVDEKNWVSMVVVNIHSSETSSTVLDSFDGFEKDFQVYTVTADSWDAVNTSEKQMVGIEESSGTNSGGSFKFPSKSITMLRWKL